MFQYIIESAAHVSGYCGKCCQCFRIQWEVISIVQDMVNSVNVGSTANVSGYEGKCCLCFGML